MKAKLVILDQINALRLKAEEHLIALNDTRRKIEQLEFKEQLYDETGLRYTISLDGKVRDGERVIGVSKIKDNGE
jgi:hypothetical protein